MASHHLRHIAWVPVQHEIRELHRVQHLGSFCTGRGVQAAVVFKNKNQFILAALVCRVQQRLVNCLSMRRRIFQLKEIEAADSICLKSFRHFDSAVEHFALLIECKAGVKIRRLFLLGADRPSKPF